MDSLLGSRMIWQVWETALSNLCHTIKSDQEIKETLSALVDSIVEATITSAIYTKRHRMEAKGDSLTDHFPSLLLK